MLICNKIQYKVVSTMLMHWPMSWNSENLLYFSMQRNCCFITVLVEKKNALKLLLSKFVGYTIEVVACM